MDLKCGIDVFPGGQLLSLPAKYNSFKFCGLDINRNAEVNKLPVIILCCIINAILIVIYIVLAIMSREPIKKKNFSDENVALINDHSSALFIKDNIDFKNDFVRLP